MRLVFSAMTLCLVLAGQATDAKMWKIRVGNWEAKTDSPDEFVRESAVEVREHFEKAIEVTKRIPIVGLNLPAFTVYKAGQITIEAYKRNTKTATTMGRIKVCLFTACTSEIYREHQLSKERRERDKKIEEYRQQTLEAMRRNEREHFISGLRETIRSEKDQVASIEESMRFINDQLEASLALASAISAEIQMREDLRAVGQTVEKADGMTSQVVARFQNDHNITKNFKKATRDLADKLMEISKTSGKDLEVLATEALRNMDDHVLVGLDRYKELDFDYLNQALKELETHRNTHLAQINSITATSKEKEIVL